MNPIINQGFELMFYGMGVVFIFLQLLVLFTIGMSTAIQTIFTGRRAY